MKQKAFTLVELLVAMSIMSIAILAAFSAVSNNIRGEGFSQDQVTAYYLADEGIEFIRNLRDQNAIANENALANGSGQISWLAGIASSGSDPCTNTACIVDSPAATLTACQSTASTCPNIRMDQSTGLFGYNGTWTATQFQRSMTVTVNSASEATITAFVTWTTDGITKTFQESEIIRNWEE